MREFIAFSLLLSLISCTTNNSLFVSLKKNKTQINFQNNLTSTVDLNILNYLYYYNGAGVAAADFNNDGLADLYFTGNQTEDKLFLNLGELQFKDITTEAHINNPLPWTTGVTTIDINNDGFLDIYICKVGKHNAIKGKNLLYLNQGLDKNGIPVFKESASLFGLDIVSLATQATFFDYDKDGDLDLFLMNHSLYPNSNYGKGDTRRQKDEMSGDKLYENKQGTYVDVSTQSGIFQGKIGYGLGVSIGDITNDGYPDIYVGNDFFENDYLYINQKDKTFLDVISKDKTTLGHTSHYSMGNAIADLNNDSRLDIISLDMLPENLTTYKTSGLEFPYQTYQYYLKNGYAPQFMQNTLHYNNGNGTYSETAYLSGIAATEWSWSPIVADYDNDGFKDLYITNGILGATNDMDYINFISNEEIQKQLATEKSQRNLELSKQIPQKKVKNYFYRNNQDKTFKNVTSTWVSHGNSYSNGGTTVDLDNDGDLDLVVSTINEDVSLYINQTNEKANYLQLKFTYPAPNTFGIGTKVYAYEQGKLQFKELYTVRGFQSSSEPMVHFGYGAIQQVDSITIVWPNKTYQTLKNIAVNQQIIISPENTKPFNYKSFFKKETPLFKKSSNNLGIHFTHVEDNYTDFNRQKLIPYQTSDRGPAIAVGDLNNDGKEDIYFGGSKFNPSKVFLQTDSIYREKNIQTIANDSITEDVVALIADLNNDQKNDVIVGTGGADFYNKMTPLLDTYYTQSSVGFEKQELPAYFENAAVIKAADYDNDGDLDVFVGNNTVSNNFGSMPNSYILKNENGKFSILENQSFQNTGMITDAIWEDYNTDGFVDLILVGEWMTPKFFKNTRGNFTEEKLIDATLTGLWQQIAAFDIDKDGDVDYLLGNWGKNSKFNASEEYPLRMYYADFDGNGSTETILCNYKNEAYYPLLGLDELASQIVSLRKKFTSYKSFAGKSIDEIFEKSVLNKARILEVHTLASGYLKNENNTFTFIPFKNELQVSPISAFLEYDFNADGDNEVLVAGNYFGVSPYQGRFDSFPGALIFNEDKVVLGNKIGLDFNQKAVKKLNIIKVQNKSYVLATINNDHAQVYELTHLKDDYKKL